MSDRVGLFDPDEPVRVGQTLSMKFVGGWEPVEAVDCDSHTVIWQRLDGTFGRMDARLWDLNLRRQLAAQCEESPAQYGESKGGGA